MINMEGSSEFMVLQGKLNEDKVRTCSIHGGNENCLFNKMHVLPSGLASDFSCN